MIIFKYTLTDQGFKKEALDLETGPGICFLTDDDGAAYAVLLNRTYVKPKELMICSERNLSPRQVKLRFRAKITTYYLKKRHKLAEYRKRYLNDLADSDFAVGLPFPDIPIKQYITSGVIRYFASLDRELFRWYQRAKKATFTGEDK